MTSMLYQRSEMFTSETSSQIYGSAPASAANFAPQRLFNAPIYASANAEYRGAPNRSINDGVVVSDHGYSRLDVSPTVRVPLSRLTFLSVNTSAAYRTTHYSSSATTAARCLTIRAFANTRVALGGDRSGVQPHLGSAERLRRASQARD